jgi:hypothetical protein
MTPQSLYQQGYPGFFISGFRRDGDEIYALLGYYVALCGNCLLMFQDNDQSHLDGSRVRLGMKESQQPIACTWGSNQ